MHGLKKKGDILKRANEKMGGIAPLWFAQKNGNPSAWALVAWTGGSGGGHRSVSVKTLIRNGGWQ